MQDSTVAEQNHLPLATALLNLASTLSILAGWLSIAHEMKRIHAFTMGFAILATIGFLVCNPFLFFFERIGHSTSKGILQTVHYCILISHTLLSFTLPPLLIATVVPAFRARFDMHRRLGLVTFPIWLYVSLTGLLLCWLTQLQLPGIEE